MRTRWGVNYCISHLQSATVDDGSLSLWKLKSRITSGWEKGLQILSPLSCSNTMDRKTSNKQVLVRHCVKHFFKGLFSFCLCAYTCSPSWLVLRHLGNAYLVLVALFERESTGGTLYFAILSFFTDKWLSMGGDRLHSILRCIQITACYLIPFFILSFSKLLLLSFFNWENFSLSLAWEGMSHLH